MANADVAVFNNLYAGDKWTTLTEMLPQLRQAQTVYGWKQASAILIVFSLVAIPFDEAYTDCCLT
jgi:NADH:ubiquinone oxidoreductase subunit E